jgi:hypothetical protein
MCGGTGIIYFTSHEQIGEVSREMAIDGGDRALEGQPIYGHVEREAPCQNCNGTGEEPLTSSKERE